MTSFQLYHRSGLLIPFEVGASDDAVKHVQNVLAAIEWAIGNGFSIAEPEKVLNGNKTYTITGWVYGRSAKQGVPVVWLYSDVSPDHKVAQVYSEKIETLPLGVDIKQSGLKPFPGGLAPKKSIAKEDGWFNVCSPFDVLLEDTGEVFEGHSVYKFVKVLSSSVPAEQPMPKPAQVPQPAPTPAPTPVTTQPEISNPFVDPNAGTTGPLARLENKISFLENKIILMFPKVSESEVVKFSSWIAFVFSERKIRDIKKLAPDQQQAAWEYLNNHEDEARLRWKIYTEYQDKAQSFETWYCEYFCNRTSTELRTLDKMSPGELKLMLERMGTHAADMNRLYAAAVAQSKAQAVGK